jgi:pimeloyl-ACP methyl ester carboxylesterase
MSFARRRFTPSVLALVIVAATQTTAAQPSNPDPFWRTFSSGSTMSGLVRWHHVTGGSGDTIVLLHGWPQTWFEWHEVMPQLAQRFRVIALDLPGLGESGDPDQYDAWTVARHLRSLLAHLQVTPVHLVGHDMGGIVAYAFARQFPGDLRTLSIVDTPIPGLSGWQELRTQTPRWHWLFHSLPDLPEALVSGKERVYLEWFLRNLAYNKAAFPDERIDEYVRAYARPSSLHAGFEYYRAFDQDEKHNQDYARAKLAMPVLAVGGEQSRLNKYVIDQLRPGTEHLTGDLAPGSGHWIPEENPQWLAGRLLTFMSAR